MRGESKSSRTKLFRFRNRSGAWSLSTYCGTDTASSPMENAIKKWNAGFQMYDTFFILMITVSVMYILHSTYLTSKQANICMHSAHTTVCNATLYYVHTAVHTCRSSYIIWVHVWYTLYYIVYCSTYSSVHLCVLFDTYNLEWRY